VIDLKYNKHVNETDLTDVMLDTLLLAGFEVITLVVKALIAYVVVNYHMIMTTTDLISICKTQQI
jgi:hypothetical protein